MTNPHTVPSIRMNSQTTIPQLGFGVYLLEPSKTQGATEEALELGYRHIDTASIYGNESEVGAAIAASGVNRDELFITSKLWNSDQGTSTTGAAFDRSLDKLGLGYVDLYLIHWPAPALSKVGETWAVLERLFDEGRTRAIGVSNFRPIDLEQLIAKSSIVPAVNQIELHPLFQQRELQEENRKHGILTQAWGPLGQGLYDLSSLTSVSDCATEYGKTPQQVVLRWHVQEQRVVFPKSAHRPRLAENFDIFDFELTPEQIAAISQEDKGQRGGPDPAELN